MGSAAVIAAALTDHSAKAKALWVGGLDVLREPGTGSGTLYGTPIESIQVEEAGAGQVSSMTFTVDDPGLELSFVEGQEVLFQDLTRDVPIFRGYLQRVERRFGAQTWRQWMITAVGVEILLDWMKIPSFSFIPGGSLDYEMQRAVTSVIGMGVSLRAGVNSAGGQPSTQAFPIGFVVDGARSGTLTNVTLRQVLNACIANWMGTPPTSHFVDVTIDFYMGVRVIRGPISLGVYSTGVSDGLAPMVTVTETGANVGTDLVYREDYSQVSHQVYVAGGAGAGSGLQTDGSPPIGDTSLLSDSTSLVEADLIGLATNFLRNHASNVSGTVTVSESLNIGTAGAERHPGQAIVITSTALGLSAASYRVKRIRKRFLTTALEEWTIDFGGQPSSVTQTMRRLTRDTLS